MLRLSLLAFEFLPAILAAIIVIIAVILGGCSSMAPPEGGTSVHTVGMNGSGTWTWNRTPQGGSDEKSSSTPVQPSN